MSSEIKDATQAMDIAHKVVQKAGMILWIVTGARRENTHWIVEVSSLAGRYTVRINALTGEVVEFRPVGQ
ncbi:MAG: hypothetical protein NC830_05085 [Candidatus Omnitrophica bacterium]|nr:hypothetical protein [Candidatus Omnitrophota bacterium]